MTDKPDEEEQIRAVALETARSVYLARQHADAELVRAKEALWEQSEWLRVTLASIGDAVITTDIEGRVLSLNFAAEKLTGWNQAEAKSRSLTEVFRIINEVTRQAVENPVETALKEGRVVGLANHTILVAKDGTETPIDDSAAPIRDDQGRVRGVVLIFRSIADRKQAEKSLRQSERELSDFFENATVGLHWVGPDGIILRVNQAELDMLGYSREEYVGRNIAEFHADPEVIADILQRLSADETLRDRQARMLCKDGSIKHVLIDSSVLWQDGRFIHTRCFTRDITDRKRAEQAQSRLAAIVESSQDAIISKTLESQITSWNAGAEQLFGYSAQEAIGQSIMMLIPPERQQEEAEILGRLRRGERIEHYETVRLHKSGRRIDVSLTISPVRDSDGRITGASKIARDITARRQADERLAVQHDVTRYLADSSTLDEVARKVLPLIGEHLGWEVGALWDLDAHQERMRCSTVWRSAAHPGLDFEADTRERTLARGIGLPGRIWSSGKAAWISDVTKDDNFPRAPAAAAEDLHAAFGFPILLNKEVLGVIEFFSPVIVAPNEELLEMTTAIGSQIGQFIERKRAEQARETSEQTTRFLANASAALADLTDYESTLQKVASLAVPRFADWCAADIQEPDGSVRRLAAAHVDPEKVELVRELDRKYPSLASKMRGARQVIKTGESEWAISIPDELLVTHTQDEEHLLIVRNLGLRSYICVPLKSRSSVLGALTFVSAESGRVYREDDVRAAEDLAHRAVIAIENANLLATLKEASHRKDEFLAMLAHELRNPLAPIRNAVQIFRAKSPPSPELQWATELIDRQVSQMTRLVDDLLDVSRITRGKIELRKESVDIATVVNNAIDISRPLIEKWGHRFTVAIPPHPILLEADSTRLTQVVSNLLNNAAKYTAPGGRIELAVERDGDHVLIRVKDNGIGISPEMLPRVFEIFMQVDRAIERAEGGLGIGLTLVKRLVEMHGGTVEARSAGAGQGSEFAVRLPISQGIQNAETQKLGGKQEVPPPPARRILVVDDNRDAADSLGMLLRLTGNEVHTAHDGLEAVGAVATFQPDVVLLDIGLPKLNGYEVARRLRQEEGGANRLLIAMTGWGQDEDRNRSREAGFDHHLTKPVEFKALQKLLSSHRVGRPNET